MRGIIIIIILSLSLYHYHDHYYLIIVRCEALTILAAMAETDPEYQVREDTVVQYTVEKTIEIYHHYNLAKNNQCENLLHELHDA